MTNESPARKNGTDIDVELRAVREELARVRELLEQKAQRRFSLRPSLRAMFVATAVIACWFAWLSYEIKHSKHVKSAAQDLARIGATVTSRPSERLLVATLPGRPADPPAQLRNLLGRDLFVQLDTLSINKLLSDEEKASLLAALQTADSLRSVRIYRTPITASDLEPLWKMANLNTLYLRETRLFRGALDGIENLPLQYFDASHTLFDDSAAASLANCEDLISVKIDRTAITDAGLTQLLRLGNLTELHIRRCPVSLKAVQAFSMQMPNCYIEYEPLLFDANGQVDALRSNAMRQRLGPRRRGSYRSATNLRASDWEFPGTFASF